MKIELCEDNGFLNDGKPTLVVLVIDQKIRIPYEATKTIQELYADVNKMTLPKDSGSSIISVLERHSTVPETIKSMQAINESAEIPEEVFDSLNTIEREDVIQCFRLEKDIDGNVNEDLEIGKEYRIVDIIKSNGKLICYEVLDDVADNKIRTPIRPDECRLVRKHFKQPPRVEVMELTKKCENCQEKNALQLKGEFYEGKCTKCGAALKEKRPEKKEEPVNV